MKIKLLLLILLSYWYQSFAQTSMDEQKNIEQKLIRNWVKYRVEMKDGSQISNEDVAKKTASMLIFKKGKVYVLISGKIAQQSVYTISNNVLVLGNNSLFTIEKLTENELIFYGNSENSDRKSVV